MVCSCHIGHTQAMLGESMVVDAICDPVWRVVETAMQVRFKMGWCGVLFDGACMWTLAGRETERERRDSHEENM